MEQLGNLFNITEKKIGSGDGVESIFPEQSYRAQETDPCWNDSVQVLFKLR